MDAALGTLRNCEYARSSLSSNASNFKIKLSSIHFRRLALSTNNIDRISNLAGMSRLKILSLGRNLIKKVRKFENEHTTSFDV